MIGYIFLLIGVFLLEIGILMFKGVIYSKNIIFIPVCGLGVSIFKKKLINIISGIDDKEITKYLIVRWIGSNMIIMSFIIIFSNIFAVIFKSEINVIIYCISLCIIIIFFLRCLFSIIQKMV